MLYQILRPSVVIAVCSRAQLPGIRHVCRHRFTDKTAETPSSTRPAITLWVEFRSTPRVY